MARLLMTMMPLCGVLCLPTVLQLHLKKYLWAYPSMGMTLLSLIKAAAAVRARQAANLSQQTP